MDDTAHQRIIEDLPADWQPPEGLIPAAAANAGGSVFDIDSDWVDDPNGYVPPGAIEGLYPVGRDGRLIGQYYRNPDHSPPRDDFRMLHAKEFVSLALLGDDPDTAVRDELLGAVTAQVEGAEAEWIWVADKPVEQIAGTPTDGGAMKVTRAALAVPVALSVRTAGRPRQILAGTLTIVWAGVAGPRRRHRVWLDLWKTLDWAVQRFRDRIFELE
ncbi:MAG: hypothetical protein J2P18_05285 [Nocardia sp.]|nr:hypothetical protein [Nocardia sp.]